MREKPPNLNQYIYKVTNTVNEKYYIGKRTCECDILSDVYMGSGTTIKNAIKKYGKDNFVKEVLCVCVSESSAYFMEKIFVGKEEVDDSQCYNMTLGGRGFCSTLSTREKISLANKGKTSSRKGVILSKETKSKISEANKGRKLDKRREPLSQETRDKMSLAAKKRGNHRSGAVLSEEKKKKISESHLRRRGTENE